MIAFNVTRNLKADWEILSKDFLTYRNFFSSSSFTNEIIYCSCEWIFSPSGTVTQKYSECVREDFMEYLEVLSLLALYGFLSSVIFQWMKFLSCALPLSFEYDFHVFVLPENFAFSSAFLINFINAYFCFYI